MSNYLNPTGSPDDLHPNCLQRLTTDNMLFTKEGTVILVSQLGMQSDQCTLCTLHVTKVPVILTELIAD